MNDSQSKNGKMKVLLINIYFPSSRVQYMLSSYALKGYFDKNSKYSSDIEVVVKNFSAADDIQMILDDIQQTQAMIVAFSCYVWNIEVVKQLVERLNQQPLPFLLLGGPEITQPNNDYEGDLFRRDMLLLLGEGEESFRKTVEYIYEHRNYPPPPRVCRHNPRHDFMQRIRSPSRSAANA